MWELGELWKSKAAEADYSKPAILNTDAQERLHRLLSAGIRNGWQRVAQKTGLDTFPVEVVRLLPTAASRNCSASRPRSRAPIVHRSSKG